MANTTYDTIKNMKPAPWSRSTVADGNALNQNFLEPTHQKDLTLADAIDQVRNTVDGYNETINNISNVADAAKSQATNAISAANEAQNDVEALQTTVTEMSAAVTEHGESIETLGNNFNTLSAAVASEAEAISNLQNNKQDKIYVDANTISGNGTENSPYTVIGGNQKELEFVDSTTVTVHKDEQDDKIIYSFSAAGGGGGGGTSYDMAWYPTVDATGNIAWEWNRTTTAPTTTNIKGPQGERGPTGPQGISGNKGNDATPITATTAAIAGGTQVTISYTSGGDPLAQFSILNGAQGASGAKGEDGNDGFSPTITTAGIEPTTEHPQGGTSVTITDKTGPNQFDVWNGINGQGATVNLLEGDGIQITHEAGTTNYTIGVSADYATKTYVDTVSSTLYDNIEYVSGQVGNKVDKPTSTQTGKLVYDTETSAWSDIGLDGYVPYTAVNLAIGSEVFASAYSFAHGWDNSANWNSVAFGTHTSSYNRSLAAGENTIALAHSLSIGGGAYSHVNIASNQSIAVGNGVSANNRSIAVGSHSTIADNDALSIGAYCLASGNGCVAVGYQNSAYSMMYVGGGQAGGQAFGEGLEITGGLAIGCFNATKDAAFVIGNGSDTAHSDSFVIYRDGHVSAAGDIWANGVKLGAGGGIVGPTGTGIEDKYWLYSTYTGNSWIEANTWLCNNFICENGISGIPDMSLGKMHIGLSGDYLPTSGGTVSGDVIVKSTRTNILAVNTTATLMGQSRVNSLTDTTAIGTNWLGVNSLGGGFLKNVQGGNVGALNGTSIQINFAPDGANSYGNITVESQGNQSKVVHVPTASYNSMTTFDPTNGPNYMLRKTASGFDIGAAVINVTTLPAQTEANTYYFIYDT